MREFAKAVLLLVAAGLIMLGMAAFCGAEEVTLKDVYADCVSTENVDQVSCLNLLFGHYIAVTSSPTEIYCSEAVTNGQLQTGFIGWYVIHSSEEPTLSHLWITWIELGFCHVEEKAEEPEDSDTGERRY